MRKARTIQSGREVWSDVIEASEVSTTPTADGIPRAVSGKIAAAWLPVGTGGDVLVRDVSSTVEVNPVAALIFPDDSLTDLGTGQVQIALGSGTGGSSVQRGIAIFTGNGSQVQFDLPVNALSAYGVDVYVRTSAGVYKHLMTDEYTTGVGYSDDLTSTGTPYISGAYPERTIDDDADTYGTHGGTGYTWIDFGEPREIAKLRAKVGATGYSGANRGNISVSHDGNSWTTLTDTWPSADGSSYRAWYFTSPGAFRYWRLFVGITYGWDAALIYELEMMEVAGGISGVTLNTAPGSGDRIEVIYYVAT